MINISQKIKKLFTIEASKSAFRNIKEKEKEIKNNENKSNQIKLP